MPDFSLVPVEHQPDFDAVSLVPVDHDPFGDSGAVQQAQLQPVQFQQPQTETQTAQPVPQTQAQQLAAGADDFFRSIPRGIVSGFNSAASALARATQAEMGQEVDAPTPEQGMQIVEKEVTGPMHRPEGRAGKFGASVGEFLGNPASYLVPGSLPFKVGTAVLGGLGSEAGGQLGEGTPLEAPFRFAGGALGFGAPSVAKLGAGVRTAQTLVPAVEETGAGLQTLTDAVPRSPASRAAEKGYPGIGTTANGGPTFVGTDYLYPAARGQQSVVRIGLTGSRRNDKVLANEAGGFTEKPEGYTWHHVDDFDPQSGMSSLELVDECAHVATNRHTGSVAQYEKHHGVRYKR
jgi:hypothetical protein